MDFEQARKSVELQRYDQAMALLRQDTVSRLDEEQIIALDNLLGSIPEEVRRRSPQMCLLSLASDLRCGRARQARAWLNQIVALRDACKEGTRERAMLVQYTCCASILMPSTDNAQLLLLLSILHSETVNYNLRPLAVSAVAGRPSVLRGAKDLSEWVKNYRAVTSILSPLFGSFLPYGGKGAASAAIAEMFYEQDNINAAAIEVAGALSAPDIEVAFAGYAQLMRIARLGGTSRSPEDIAATLERMLNEKQAQYLMLAYNALCIRQDICAGRLQRVREWVEQCRVNELENCHLARSYELITRAQALIALGRCREALTLLESLTLMLQEDTRPLDTVECLAHSAVACELLGSRDLALDKLGAALRMAAPYRYIRVLADCGPVMFHLLSLLLKDERAVEPLPDHYTRALLNASKNYSMLFPALYRQDISQENGAPIVLTSAELCVLRLVSDGKTNREIAEELSIKMPTVKFHTAHIFEKLGVSNRAGAVSAAKTHGIL